MSSVSWRAAYENRQVILFCGCGIEVPMTRSVLLAFAVLLLLPAAAAAFNYSGWQRGPWERVDEVDGVEVFRNTTVGGGIHAYRADVTVNAPAQVVLGLVLDHDRARSRSFVKRYDVLFDDGARTRVYQQIQRPGLGRREFTAVGEIFRAKDGASGFDFRMVDDGTDAPDVPSFAAMEGSFVLTPVNTTQTRLSYRMLVDPDSWIPNFALRGALRDGAVEVVELLRDDAEK